MSETRIQQDGEGRRKTQRPKVGGAPVGEITLPGRGGGASTGVLANAGLGAPPPRFLITPAALEALLGAPAAAVAITAAGGS